MKYTVQQQKESAELLKTLAQKAWESSTFKEQLINNPLHTIGQIIGKDEINIYEKKVVVEDQTDDSVIYLNIPAKVDIDELELTEEQLETISGGSTPVCGAYVLGFCVAVGLCYLIQK